MFELQSFRQQLGVELNQYKTMSNFKSRVLDPAIKQINKYTDITVKYDQHKQGRVITGFTFTFVVKAKAQKPVESNRDANTPDMLTPLKMTDKQRRAFADKLSRMSELSSYSEPGKDYHHYAKKIEEDLLDNSKYAFYIPYLNKLGFELS